MSNHIHVKYALRLFDFIQSSIAVHCGHEQGMIISHNEKKELKMAQIIFLLLI